MFFNFFKQKSNPLASSVVRNGVYRNKTFVDQLVVVCGVSKPDLKTTDDVDNECFERVQGIDVDHVPGNALIYMNVCDKTYHHRRNAINKNIVLFKSLSMIDTDNYAYTNDMFTSQYELVVGYMEDGTPITASDIRPIA